jgi:hypothetical protein
VIRLRAGALGSGDGVVLPEETIGPLVSRIATGVITGRESNPFFGGN